jgi:hypothetical protein
MPNATMDIDARIELSDPDFREIARAGGINLNADLQRRVQNIMRLYDLFHRLHQRTKDDRARLTALLRHLDGTIGAAQALTRNRPLYEIIFWRADLSPENTIAALMSLRDRVQWGLQPDTGRYRRLPQLLFALEEIFIEAGGGSTKINRPRESEDDRMRRSPFIDFAWQILQRIPECTVPGSHQALASAWEDISPQRREGAVLWSQHYRKTRKIRV